ncbi:unnamed protein product [Brugia pahangi]|uniref:Ig-like domain-containing protein n=1 Tax=Brugia pahangi TaxID=6280 RepID=A0A158PSF8_BRUPA|nr:unnamed protein product [Brugia pahangi]
MKVEGAGAVQDFRILELVKLKSNDLNGWCCDSVSVQRTWQKSMHTFNDIRNYWTDITDTGEGHQFACSISNRIKAYKRSNPHCTTQAFLAALGKINETKSLVSFKAFKNISEIPELKSNTVNDNAQLLTVLQVSSARYSNHVSCMNGVLK